MLNPETRVCGRSGFQLIRYEYLTGFQVSKPAYSGRSGPPRLTDLGAHDWNRWDTRGQTYYYAETPLLAFIEVLAHLRQEPAASAKDADYAAFLGMNEDDLAAALSMDRHEAGLAQSERAAMQDWRTKHEVFRMSLPVNGWWIDTSSAHTLTALGRILRTRPGVRARLNLAGRPIDRSDLLGGDRLLTTTLARLMKGAVLDDDTQALGLTFESRRHRGTCMAFWDREGPQPYLVRSRPISRDDENYTAACIALGLTAF